MVSAGTGSSFCFPFRLRWVVLGSLGSSSIEVESDFNSELDLSRAARFLALLGSVCTDGPTGFLRIKLSVEVVAGLGVETVPSEFFAVFFQGDEPRRFRPSLAA